MSVEEVRENFPYIKDGRIYFNHASLGPLSNRVTSRINKFVEQRSTGPIDNFSSLLKSSASAKSQLGKLLNCLPERISWTDNVSNSLNMIANGLDLKPGDRIILFEGEFPSNVYPFLNLKAKGIEIDFVKTRNHKIAVEDIEVLITPKTKLLSISLVQFLSGFRADLDTIGEICDKHNIIFSVDAIQGAGVVKIDVEKSKVDFLVGGSQKWLMGLQGASYFFISEKLQERITQPYVGWTSVKDAWNLTEYNLRLKDKADSFQNGTMNSLGITALDESLKLFNEFGIDKIEIIILNNTEYFRNKLAEAGIEMLLKSVSRNELAGITTIKIPSPENVYKELSNNNIICSLREGYLRFAPHFYNIKSEIDKVVKVLAQLI